MIIRRSFPELTLLVILFFTSMAKAGSEIVPGNAPAFLDRAERSLCALLDAEPLANEGDLDLAMLLVRLRGGAEDRALLQKCAARLRKPSTDAVAAAISPLLRDARIAMVTGNREMGLAKVAAAEEKLKAVDQTLVNNIMRGTCLYLRANLGDADVVLEAMRRDPAVSAAVPLINANSVAATSIVMEAYARGDKVLLEKFLPLADSNKTMERMGRLAEAERAAESITQPYIRAQRLTSIAGAYKATGDSAACQQCLIAARRAVDTDGSCDLLASFGMDAVRVENLEVATAALEAAAKRLGEHPTSSSGYIEARLAATLGDQVKAAAFTAHFEKYWKHELGVLQAAVEKEKVEPDVIDLGNGKTITHVTDVPQETAEHELKRAGIAAAGGDLKEMKLHLMASVKAKLLKDYANSDGFSNIIESLAARHDYAACEQVIRDLALRNGDIDDIHGTLMQQAVTDGKWDQAWAYIKSFEGTRWIGWRMRICEHWLEVGSLNKCLELLDSMGSPYDRGLIALHLAARCKGLPGACALDVALRSEARRR